MVVKSRRTKWIENICPGEMKMQEGMKRIGHLDDLDVDVRALLN